MVALAVLVVYAVLFFLMNRQDVAVSLVVTTWSTMPLVWTLLGTFPRRCAGHVPAPASAQAGREEAAAKR